jgi:hypothetical protein
MNSARLFLLLILKSIWLVAGGWLWTMSRHITYSIVKSNTFKAPTSIGVAMVLFPLVAILFTLLCLIAGWSVGYVLIWLGVMGSGVFLRPPLELIGKMVMINRKVKKKWKQLIKNLRKEIETLLAVKPVS